MKILVCIKQVVDGSDTLSLDGETGSLEATSSTVYRMNRADEFALEEALLLRESLGRGTVDAVTVGPSRAVSVLRRAVEMGVDGAIHILCPDDAPLGPTFVARALSSWTKRHGYDLVLAGVMSEDAMAGVTGNLVAAFLSCPCATSVVEVEPVVACDRVQAVSEVEGGVRHVYAIELPAVLAIQTGINVPRYPTLTNVLKARTMKPVTVPIESLGPGDSPEPIRSYRRPEERRKGAFLEGSPRDKAHALADFLRDQGLLP